MTILHILKSPHPALKTPASMVSNVDSEIAKTLDDMLETMYAGKGIGLAGNQVGVLKRLLVMDVEWRGQQHGTPYLMVNPVITWRSEEINTYEEGCLSFPGHYADVVRPKMVRVDFINQSGNPQSLEADGLLATCLQHEIDHLDGIVFVDHLTRMKRDIILRKMQKSHRRGGFEEEAAA